MHHYRLLTILTATVLCATLPASHAAELGEPVVKSRIGQQLVADIELLPDEGGAVRAAIAHDDVYRGANIARSPVVDTLNLSVMRRDGRQYLHITSLKPVEAGYLHLYLELAEHGKRKIRPATLWLQPEPPVPVRAAIAPAAAPATALAVAREPVRATPKQAPATPRPVQQDVACQALDYKNAQLSAQIVDLEEKVKALQYAVDMQGTRVPSARQAATRGAPAAATRPPAAAASRPVAAPEQGAWWPAFAGVGVLVLGGGGWWARRRWHMRAEAEEPVEN